MSVALRALVVLFRYVKREKKLDRKILAFSVSHDHTSVRVYGHYPVIEGDKTTFYRHPIRQFYFTDGEEKWTAYKFTKNVYDIWMPILHEKICSAIDDLPADISFDLSQSVFFSESTPQSSQQSNADTTLGENSQSRFLASQKSTPTASFTQATEPAFKKPRNKRAGGQQRWNFENRRPDTFRKFQAAFSKQGLDCDQVNWIICAGHPASRMVMRLVKYMFIEWQSDRGRKGKKYINPKHLVVGLTWLVGWVLFSEIQPQFSYIIIN